MTLSQKLIGFAVLAVVIFVLNIAAQKVFPTKASDPYGQKVIFRGLVYLMFVGLLGAVVVIGLALSH
jgi:hypothetical protein